MHGRIDALRLLAIGDAHALIHVAEEVSGPQAPESLRVAAARAVSDCADPTTTAWLINAWSAASPAVRVELLDGLVRTPERANELLDAVEAGTIKPVEIPAERREQLHLHPVAAVKDRAAKLFEAASADRAKVVAEFEGTIDSGSSERGLAVFKKTCAQCHKVGDDGFNVGPELVSVKNKSSRDLLLAILDPNREALPKFTSYTVATDDGRIFTGILASETDSSITLRRAEGKEDVVLRNQIETLKSNGQSLMPVGLEKDLSPQDVADVVTWIKGL
jgi:putative heme-binding domain-containing protein